MLSPYIRAEGLNSGMTGTSLIVEGVGNLKDGLDKRSSGLAGGIRAVKDTVNIAKAVSDTITNLSGVRSPYFVIGEVAGENSSKNESMYKWGSTGTLIRAIARDFSAPRQEGVIIDCLGDISGSMGVEFTKNPLVYQSSTIVDSRVRKPTTLKATIAVSNYLSDNLLGASASTLDQLSGGLSSIVSNELLYDGNTRSQYALYKLRWLLENAIPFTVYTPHGIYENMLIETLTPKTDANTMDCLMCEVTFREVIMWRPYFANTSVADMPERKNVARTEGGEFVKNTKWAEGTAVGNFVNKVSSWLT
jgi:hypothetical protein